MLITRFSSVQKFLLNILFYVEILYFSYYEISKSILRFTAARKYLTLKHSYLDIRKTALNICCRPLQLTDYKYFTTAYARE